jgi:D-sedoheptulose 7-phosphate isomerase
MIKDYLEIVKQALNDLPFQAMKNALHQLRVTREAGGTIWLAGNGGSAATAEHFACDLSLANCRAQCLTDNAAMLTAYSNDKDYDWALAWILTRQAKAGDCLIAISTSGNSKNILQVVRQADIANIPVIGMTGKAGGELAGKVTVSLAVQTDDIQVIEDLHLMMCHIMVRELRDG